jgi:hypothetical protein
MYTRYRLSSGKLGTSIVISLIHVEETSHFVPVVLPASSHSSWNVSGLCKNRVPLIVVKLPGFELPTWPPRITASVTPGFRNLIILVAANNCWSQSNKWKKFPALISVTLPSNFFDPSSLGSSMLAATNESGLNFSRSLKSSKPRSRNSGERSVP